MRNITTEGVIELVKTMNLSGLEVSKGYNENIMLSYRGIGKELEGNSHDFNNVLMVLGGIIADGSCNNNPEGKEKIHQYIS